MVLQQSPLFAVLVLVAVPISLVSEKSGSYTNINAGMDNLQETTLSAQNELSSIGLASPLALPFKPVETHSNEKSANSSRKQYHYEHNGVSITVEFEVYTFVSVPTLKQITGSISEQLKHAPGLELVDLQYEHAGQLNHKLNRDTNLRSVFHSAKYLMQPFGKVIHYEVRNYIHHNQRWMITSSYKACDASGEKLTKKFLDTLSFI